MRFLLLVVALLSNAIAFAAESKKTRNLDCYTIGFRWAQCALTVTEKVGTCSAANDFVVPERCRNGEESSKGIKAGTFAFYRALQIKK
jgi:hypothetical protein